jgi:rod shape-determining protein MreD
MRWWALVLVASAAIVVETSLRQAFTLGGVSPSVMTCVAVFVALFAPKRIALWSCWGLGLCIDLMTAYAQTPGNPPLYVLGPHALAYTALAGAVLLARSSVFRQRVLTISVLTFAASIVEGLVALLILLIRSWYPSSEQVLYFGGSSLGGALLHLLGTAAYSAVLALPVGWLLLTTIPMWRFETFGHRYAWR